MANPLTNYIPSTGDNNYYTREFMNEVKMNLPAIINAAKNVTTVSAIDAVTFKGDFYGFLKTRFPTISYEHYWTTMIVNGMDHPSEFDETYPNILLLGDAQMIVRLNSKVKTKVASAF